MVGPRVANSLHKEHSQSTHAARLSDRLSRAAFYLHAASFTPKCRAAAMHAPRAASSRLIAGVSFGSFASGVGRQGKHGCTASGPHHGTGDINGAGAAPTDSASIKTIANRITSFILICSPSLVIPSCQSENGSQSPITSAIGRLVR